MRRRKLLFQPSPIELNAIKRTNKGRWANKNTAKQFFLGGSAFLRQSQRWTMKRRRRLSNRESNPKRWDVPFSERGWSVLINRSQTSFHRVKAKSEEFGKTVFNKNYTEFKYQVMVKELYSPFAAFRLQMNRISYFCLDVIFGCHVDDLLTSVRMRNHVSIISTLSFLVSRITSLCFSKEVCIHEIWDFFSWSDRRNQESNSILKRLEF